MLKIITVLATTFLFAGLLIAHPYTSPSTDPAGVPPKVATAAPAQGQPNQGVATAEQSPAPSKTTVAGLSGGDAATSTAVAARPQLDRPVVQSTRPANDNRYAAPNAGIAGIAGSQMQAPVIAPPPTRAPTPASLNVSTGPRRDGRHRSQLTDVTPSRIDPPSANPGIRIVFARPMPLEERIHLEHSNRTYRQ
jgi:hypothetical protein